MKKEKLKENEKNSHYPDMNYSISLDFSSYQNTFGSTNGMWMIENEDFKKGGQVEWDMKIRLRHFSSAKCLAIKKNQFTNSYEIYLTDILDKNSLFQFILQPNTIDLENYDKVRFVMKDSIVEIKNLTNKCFLTCDSAENQKLKAVDFVGDEASFKIHSANFNEILETSFLLSCSHPLKKLHQVLAITKLNNSLKKSLQFERKLKDIFSFLDNLNKFCTNMIIVLHPDQEYCKHNTSRQRVAKKK